MLVDMPVSAIAYALAWKHGTVAAIWVVVVGTLWWYLLSRGLGLLIAKLLGPNLNRVATRVAWRTLKADHRVEYLQVFPGLSAVSSGAGGVKAFGEFFI